MFGKRTGMRKDSEFLSLVFDNIRENIVVVNAENTGFSTRTSHFLSRTAFPWKKVGKSVVTR